MIASPERGFSLLEAIIVTTITALLAFLLLPLIPSGAQRSAALAERSVDTLGTANNEREFRLLLRSAMPSAADAPRLDGNEAGVAFQATLEAPLSCAPAGAPTLRLSLESNALVCGSGAARRVLLRWREGERGAFAYSRDGRAWQTSWRNVEAPLVRLEVGDGVRRRLVWIERAGGGAP